MGINASQNLPSDQTQDLRCDLDRGKKPINAGVIAGMGVNGRVFGSARTLLYESTLSISGLDFARSIGQFFALACPTTCLKHFGIEVIFQVSSWMVVVPALQPHDEELIFLD